jgi:putative sigma-54 modulation protein
MKMDIRTQGFELTDGLREHAERRLSFALDWARHDVRKIILNFSDINGPRGGSDKRCQLRIPLPRIRDVIIEAIAPDIFQAVDRAIERASRTLARRISRQREFGRSMPIAMES